MVICLALAVEVGPLAGLDKVGPVEWMKMRIVLEQIELHRSDGSIVMANDNWKDAQQADIEATGLAPKDDKEAALIATLPPGNYTAIVTGKNGGTGVALAEAYDADQSADSRLANISTRA